MKNRFVFALTVATTMFTISAHAHDPAMHEKEAKAADCSQMNNMDMSKMDPNDPVMKAMHERCAAGTKHEPTDKGGMHDMKGMKDMKSSDPKTNPHGDMQ